MLAYFSYLMMGRCHNCKLHIAAQSAICMSIVARLRSSCPSPANSLSACPRSQGSALVVAGCCQNIRLVAFLYDESQSRALKFSETYVLRHVRDKKSGVMSYDRGHPCKDDDEKYLPLQRYWRLRKGSCRFRRHITSDPRGHARLPQNLSA